MRYFKLYKPFGMLSQFSREMPEHRTLADLDIFPSEVYPIGRLDKDSEGLLLLTDDKQLNHRLLDPKFQHPRTYWVQVEGLPAVSALAELRAGVDIRINKKVHHTLPAQVQLLEEVPDLPDRDPPIRFRANIPTQWLEITLTEGKNRQVRRMCAKVGFPVLRLVRSSIVGLKLGPLDPGQVEELDAKTLYRLLEIPR